MSELAKNKNDRFQWNIGAIAEVFPDMAAVDDSLGVVLWDRQEKKPVITLHHAYGNAFCLETTDSEGTMPFTTLENFFNRLTNVELESEGIAPTVDTSAT